MPKSDNNSGKKLLTRREFLVGGGAMLAVATLAACSNKVAPSTSGTSSSTGSSTATGSASTPRTGGILRVIETPTPTMSFGWPPDFIASPNELVCCLDTLLRTDYQGNLHPWLAESYEVANDLKSITFTLQKGVKFHDGSDFNSDVTKWNLDNMMAAYKVPYLASTDVIDDYTIRANFTQWQSTAPYAFGDSGTQVYMVSKVAFDKNGIDWVRKNPVGTGPFKFVSYANDVGAKFVMNPDYWRKDTKGNRLPYLEGMTSVYVADPTTQKKAMQAGEGDMMTFMISQWANDMAKLGLTVHFKAINTTNLIPDSVNADSVWSKKEVREAAEYAIDKEGIAKAFGYGYFLAPYQIAGHDSANYEPNFPYVRKYDPDKARQLLAAAGYPDGFKTTIWCLADLSFRDVLVAVQANWASIGIQADLEFPDMGGWMQFQFNGTWHNGCVFTTQTSDAKYIGGFEAMFTFIGKGWLRSAVMPAYEAYLAAPNPDIKLALAVTDAVSKDALWIPVCEAGEGWAYQPYVKDTGVGDINRQQYLKYEQAWLNK